MNVSIYQMEILPGDPEANLRKVEKATEMAKDRGSHVLVLPEFWSTGFDFRRIRQEATSISEGMFASVSDLAKTYGMGILGSCPSVHTGKVFNTAVLFGRKGEVLGRYDKIHLFAPMDEDKHLTPGSLISVFDTEWGRIGLALCFDLRFPELFRRIVLDGAEVVFVPAFWPAPRLDHWRLLLRARAVENQVFTAGCNRSRKPGDQEFGYSAVVDPEGKVLMEAGVEEMLMTVDIDLDRVKAVRDRLPFLSSRRPEVYESL